jgi:hypothetical protein
MARRSVWVQMQREAERRRREAERAARALERERKLREKAAARQRAFDEKEQKRLYLDGRAQEADDMSRELVAVVDKLEGLLTTSLSADPTLELDALKETPVSIPFEPGDLATPIEPPIKTLPPAPSALAKLVPGTKAKFAEAVAAAEADYEKTLVQAVQAEHDRQEKLADAEREHQTAVRAQAQRSKLRTRRSMPSRAHTRPAFPTLSSRTARWSWRGASIRMDFRRNTRLRMSRSRSNSWSRWTYQRST